MSPHPSPIGPVNSAVKRAFDLCAALVGLGLTWWIIAAAWICTTIDTSASGFFTQDRIGRDGRVFRIIKLRTMRQVEGVMTAVTTAGDPRITPFGRLLRRTKIDELPQLLNIVRGDMSFVGPRPDVPGFADALVGEDRAVLRLRPGITGPATLRFRNEEVLLAGQADPERYNQEVLFPAKVRINLAYIRNYSFGLDMHCIAATLFGGVVKLPGDDPLL